MFDREIKLIGEDSFHKIQNATVAIVGLGGVGGYTLEALVRSGVGTIVICDNDKVDITNLNRQILTNINNIGNKKVDVAKERALLINPNIKIITLDLYLDHTNMSELFSYHIDYLVDACDSINTKKSLIKECISRNIKIISCMGTGNKRHPELFKIDDIRKTSYDPLAKILRKYVKDEKIHTKIPVLYSTEAPYKKDTSKTIASISYVPGCAGLLLASYVINDILNDK